MLEIKNVIHHVNNSITRIKYLKENLQYNTKKSRLLEINLELSLPEVWNIRMLVKKLNQEKKILSSLIEKINEIEKNAQEMIFFLKIAMEEKDYTILSEITREMEKITVKIKTLELYCMFSKKHDYCNCYIDIQSGSGGIEAQDWAQILLRMYLKWANKKKFKTEIIEESSGEIVGIKSTTVKVYGEYAFGWFRTETGIHRLIRKSPFDAGKRRHTSFSSIFIYPEIADSIAIDISSSELRIDVYRASGAGGQHVNKTESAVRITHLPTNIVTQCQSNRSQHKNKEQAIKQMKAKLYEIHLKKKKEEKKTLEEKKSNISWGNQIRSYIFDSSKIKDLRTGIETNDVQSVLNGNLDHFIEQSLKIGL